MRHKLRAVRTTYNNKSYASKLEAAYAAHLDDLKKDGLILFYLEQVPFRFWDTSKYVLDFMVFTTDGEVKFIETKGKETAEFRRKMKLMKREYPQVDVIIVKGQVKDGQYVAFKEEVYGVL